VDVSDAFLTVKQETPTVVTCVDASGKKQEFGLGKVLPGQRDGALLWYRDITGLLKNKLGMEEMAACPCLLRARGQALVLLRVDDLLVGRLLFHWVALVASVGGEVLLEQS